MLLCTPIARIGSGTGFASNFWSHSDSLRIASIRVGTTTHDCDAHTHAHSANDFAEYPRTKHIYASAGHSRTDHAYAHPSANNGRPTGLQLRARVRSDVQDSRVL
jgi:hypothetical protein